MSDFHARISIASKLETNSEKEEREEVKGTTNRETGKPLKAQVMRWLYCSKFGVSLDQFRHILGVVKRVIESERVRGMKRVRQAGKFPLASHTGRQQSFSLSSQTGRHKRHYWSTDTVSRICSLLMRNREMVAEKSETSHITQPPVSSSDEIVCVMKRRWWVFRALRRNE